MSECETFNGKPVFDSLADLPFDMNTFSGWRRNGFAVDWNGKPCAYVRWENELCEVYDFMQVNIIKTRQAYYKRSRWFERYESTPPSFWG